jgi:hypothetical protein
MTKVGATKYLTLVRSLQASAEGSTRRPEANIVPLEHTAGNGGVVPQSVAENNGECLDRPAGDLSPGKKHDSASSVVHYISQIGETWRRVVQSMMEVARLCAEANARLKAAQKSELIEALPFGGSIPCSAKTPGV